MSLNPEAVDRSLADGLLDAPGMDVPDVAELLGELDELRGRRA